MQKRSTTSLLKNQQKHLSENGQTLEGTTKTIGQLKNDLWKLVSLFVRKSAANEWGMVACVTCQKIKHYKEMQAGHFVPGRHNAILFDLRGIHPQCYTCNIILGGNTYKYGIWMKENYGSKVIKELIALDDDPEGKKFTKQELLSMIQEFKERLKEFDCID